MTKKKVKKTTAVVQLEHVDKETYNEIEKVLNSIFECITQGFSHENYVQILRLLNFAGKHLRKSEIEALEEQWRDSYTDSCDQYRLNELISEIKSRFVV